jgi:predicted kinase
MLIIFGGLPATGKTTIARELARQIGATFLRIDSIEQMLRACNPERPVDEAGYRVAYAIAEDNLRLGRTVVADSVNPLQTTRDAWIDVGRRTGAKSAEIEVICFDQGEHQRRVEQRVADINGLNYQPGSRSFEGNITRGAVNIFRLIRRLKAWSRARDCRKRCCEKKVSICLQNEVAQAWTD